MNAVFTELSGHIINQVLLGKNIFHNMEITVITVETADSVYSVQLYRQSQLWYVLRYGRPGLSVKISEGLLFTPVDTYYMYGAIYRH